MGNFINFFDGYTSTSVPIITQVDRLYNFANDAEFEAAIAGAPFPGNLYYNTTSERIRYYTSDHWDFVPDGITFDQLALDVSNHISAVTGAHAASAISYSPSGNIVAINVQDAITELDTEKLDKSGGTITGDLIVSGDLTVNGTTTSINTTTLEVTDSNVTINNNGTQATADANDAGITIEMSDATDAIIGYDSSTQSKFKIGEIGSTEEILTTNHVQDITNKTFTDAIISEEQSSTPSTPPSGDQKIYPKIDGKWYSLDDTGTETLLGSGAGGFVKVNYHDPVSSTLPTGATVTIDGQSGVDGDLVLFSNLSSGNNKIYELSGVGVSISWTATTDFNLGTPESGDTVIILSGDSFREAVGKFNGTDWVFNDTVRYYSGADYWEQSSLKTTDIIASTTASIFEVTLAGSENIIIDYSILRGSTKETGSFVITSDGTSIGSSQAVANIGDVGVVLFADEDTGNLRFRYTADSSGNGSIKYTVKRWSNSAGGPGGIPSYSGATGGGSASGNNKDIQYNSGGSLAGDSTFQWDSATSEMKLGLLSVRALISSVTMLDNQPTETTLFSVDGSLTKFIICEYSIERGTESRVGTLMICHNSTIATITDVSNDTGGAGIADASIHISATYSGGNMIVQYTTDSTGNNADFKYNLRKWL